MRREFSTAVRRAAWARANGACEMIVDGRRCNAPIDLGGFHYDHTIPVWFCDDATLENCQVVCVPCHRDKTNRDLGNIAKSKRIINKRIKATKSKRGFRGWRKFDGTVVVRRG